MYLCLRGFKGHHRPEQRRPWPVEVFKVTGGVGGKDLRQDRKFLGNEKDFSTYRGWSLECEA